MKELSIEEKAKRYDEAIDKIADVIEAGTIEQGLAEWLFPELKESEDEKMRKEIIKYLEQSVPHHHHDEVLKSKEWIAWLEKQGEQKPIDKIQLGKKYMCIASPRYSTFMIGEIYKPEDKFLCSLMNFCYDCFEPIEDGEQKPADKIEPKFKVGDEIKTSNEESLTITKIDENGYWSEDLFICGFDDADKWELVEQKLADKVEPKFKVGDWITNSDYTWKIIEVKPLDYILQSQNGNIVDDTISHVDEQFHSFTLEDAKDGDVLACNEEILLFKSYSVQGRISLYCWYNGQTNNLHDKEVDNTLVTTRNKICPATKEQRDLLFQKMGEAGYEWNPIEKCLMEVPKTKEEGGVLGKLINEPKELTEFESELCRLFQNFRWKDKPVTNETVLEYVESHSDELLSIARKQIVSEIDVDAIVTDYKTMLNKKGVETFDGFAASVYGQGIIRVLEKIKED